MSMQIYQIAVQTERRLLPARAERGWRAEAAAAEGPRSSRRRAARLRWVAGALLIRVGARLQKAPTVAPALGTPAH